MASSNGVLSKGIKFYAKSSTTVPTSWAASDEIPDLQSIPSLGGDPEKVEVTTLADGARRYISGIKDYGDLEFKFLFDNGANSAFRKLKAFEDAGDNPYICVELPDTGTSHGTQFIFKSDMVVSMDEAEVNAALTFTLKCGLKSDISVENPD